MSRKKWLELHNSLKLEYPIVALSCIILGKTYLLHAYWVTNSVTLSTMSNTVTNLPVSDFNPFQPGRYLHVLNDFNEKNFKLLYKKYSARFC